MDDLAPADAGDAGVGGLGDAGADDAGVRAGGADDAGSGTAGTGASGADAAGSGTAGTGASGADAAGSGAAGTGASGADAAGSGASREAVAIATGDRDDPNLDNAGGRDVDDPSDVGGIVARLVGGGSSQDQHRRRRELRSLVGALTTSARRAGRTSVLGGRWLTDLLVEAAPRLPLRDLPTLRSQHPGLGDEDLTAALISGAAKATAAVGAAGGTLAAVEFAAPPTLLTAPVQIAAETLLVAAIEVKLIAELHEIHRAAARGSARQRAGAYLVAWTNRRGIDPTGPGALRFSPGAAAKAALRRRLVRRAGRNLSTMGPLLSGAVAGSVINHRETRKLGEQVALDLRRRRIR